MAADVATIQQRILAPPPPPDPQQQQPATLSFSTISASSASMAAAAAAAAAPHLTNAAANQTECGSSGSGGLGSSSSSSSSSSSKARKWFWWNRAANGGGGGGKKICSSCSESSRSPSDPHLGGRLCGGRVDSAKGGCHAANNPARVLGHGSEEDTALWTTPMFTTELAALNRGRNETAKYLPIAVSVQRSKHKHLSTLPATSAYICYLREYHFLFLGRDVGLWPCRYLVRILLRFI